MKEFYRVEGWDEKRYNFGGGVLYGRDAYGELEQAGLRCLGLELLFDALEIGSRDAVCKCV